MMGLLLAVVSHPAKQETPGKLQQAKQEEPQQETVRKLQQAKQEEPQQETVRKLQQAKQEEPQQETVRKLQQAKQEEPQHGKPQQSKQENQEQSGKERELEQPGKVEQKASKGGEGRLFFTGAGNNQVVVGNAGYILVGLISLFALVAVIAAAFTGRRRLDKYRYPPPTSYDELASHEDNSYNVHRSLDEAAKKFE
ncbi:general transcriptional corepressor trfA-like [Procambarus clarkii]|uniref:general transcriptional corepressor trfA-like n=1 Tax=Procambarus clarkii TaxID=6728 RepID=UPI0037428186